MKKRMKSVIALLLAASMLTACAGGKTSDKSTLKAEDFETDQEFITIVDATPNPNDKTAMDLYTDLGVNTFVLTEDYATMTENGTLSDAYKNAIKEVGK